MIRRGILAALVTVGVIASSAAAHSLLLESSPGADTTLTTPPSHLMLRFNNRIEKRLSRITVLDEGGTARALAIAVDGGADRLTAPVPALAPGAYRVEWHVLSTDGHVVSGAFGFRLAR